MPSASSGTGNAEVAGYLYNMDEAAIAAALEKMIAGLPAREPLVSPTRTPRPHEF